MKIINCLLANFCAAIRPFFHGVVDVRVTNTARDGVRQTWLLKVIGQTTHGIEGRGRLVARGTFKSKQKNFFSLRSCNEKMENEFDDERKYTYPTRH